MPGGLIKTEGIEPGALAYDRYGVAKKELLAGEIAAVRAWFVAMKPETSLACAADRGHYHTLFFVRGSGTASCCGQTVGISELAVWIPAANEPYTVCCHAGIEFLEIGYDAKDTDDTAWMRRPHFCEYLKSPTYREAIKSEKTINRTLVDVNTMPRFCMGSVETQGEDAVQPHSHPMVEQLFFGLPGNSCTVSADGEATYFGENTLLHIPPGSTHGVAVEKDCCLHYLWLDFFKDNDMSYIAEQHHQNAEQVNELPSTVPAPLLRSSSQAAELL